VSDPPAESEQARPGLSPSDDRSAGGQAGRPAVGTGPGGRPRRPRRFGRLRRRSRRRTAFFVLAGAAIVALGAWALLSYQLLVVRSVSVTGTRLVTPAQVLAAADVSLGTPLISVDPGAVTRRVESIRDVASATVSRNWPDHLVIAVTERVPVMAVPVTGGGYDQLDASGVIVRWTQARPAALPLLMTTAAGSGLRAAPAVTAAAGVLAELQPWLARQVTEVAAAPVAAGPEQVTLSLRGGKTVQWGSTGNAAQKNRELAVLLPGSARDIDVSAPGTVATR
jgi:cell division protein FtsQ